MRYTSSGRKLVEDRASGQTGKLAARLAFFFGDKIQSLVGLDACFGLVVFVDLIVFALTLDRISSDIGQGAWFTASLSRGDTFAQLLLSAVIGVIDDDEVAEVLSVHAVEVVFQAL